MSEKDYAEKRLYPSVNLAYDLALSAYDFAQKRLDILDVRLQTLLAFGTTISLAIPATAISKHISFNSWWFIAGVLFFAFAIIVGTYTRASGYMQIILLDKVNRTWLGASEAEFKRNLIHYASRDFKLNIDLVNKKGRFFGITVLLFFTSWLCATVWIILGRS